MYADEPNVVYIYFAHHKGKVGQAEYYTIDGTNLSPEQLKHFEEYE